MDIDMVSRRIHSQIIDVVDAAALGYFFEVMKLVRSSASDAIGFSHAWRFTFTHTAGALVDELICRG
jgi:hypothetical protein